MLPFLSDLVWVWVKMSMKLPNSCWLTDAALPLQSLLSSGTTHTSKSGIFQVLKWTGNSRWRWPWNQFPGLKTVICRPMGDIAMTTFLLCSDTQEIIKGCMWWSKATITPPHEHVSGQKPLCLQSSASINARESNMYLGGRTAVHIRMQCVNATNRRLPHPQFQACFSSQQSPISKRPRRSSPWNI